MAVLKIGGSVLRDQHAYHESAELVRDQLRSDPECRLLVVVSAEAGATDALEQLACDIASSPDSRLLDLLWSVGERKSAALLALCLQRAGVDATALDLQQIGLKVRRGSNGGVTAQLSPARLQHELKRHPVVVIPGFFGVDADGGVVSLGRGGSDLTAVLFACELGAERCELVKDVAGFFTADPNKDASARPIAELTHNQALEMAQAGCDLVQLRALREAASRRLTLVVRSLDRSSPGTRVVGSHEAGDLATWRFGDPLSEWAIG
ncbi:MAG: hypothetical protein HYS05_14040 [Acidobacteria bacterium]|nr:hypothetical protein [Acidobacteriota bacterium]